MRPITLLVGVPGAGKSWVANQVKDDYHYVPNDEHIGKDYVGALLKASESDGPTVLGECPFSVSAVLDPLKAKGRQVKTVFIVEHEKVLTDRYRSRSGKQIPSGHLTRNKTYLDRAHQSGSFFGTSGQVLQHLKKP